MTDTISPGALCWLRTPETLTSGQHLGGAAALLRLQPSTQQSTLAKHGMRREARL